MFQDAFELMQTTGIAVISVRPRRAFFIRSRWSSRAIFRSWPRNKLKSLSNLANAVFASHETSEMDAIRNIDIMISLRKHPKMNSRHRQLSKSF